MPENNSELPITTVKFRLQKPSRKPPAPATYTHINYLGPNQAEVSQHPLIYRREPDQGNGLLRWLKKLVGLQSPPAPAPQPSIDWNSRVKEAASSLRRNLREREHLDRQKAAEEETWRNKQKKAAKLI